MEEKKLIALHDTLKAGAPRGRVGGLGVGTQRGSVAAATTGLPDSPLYRHFVKEGAALVPAELVLVGVPKHTGSRMTFDDDGGEVYAPGAAAVASSTRAFTLKQMKRAVVEFLGRSRGGRAREKRVRSAALEAAEGTLNDAEAGTLYARALRKLLKRGRVSEEAGELVARFGGAEEEGPGRGAAAAADGGGGAKSYKRDRV